uniref:Putative secreted protein n=1 Tax=Xenopsylla cheopis TaxID=163159 RepID=A0A6M2E279_XENCH
MKMIFFMVQNFVLVMEIVFAAFASAHPITLAPIANVKHVPMLNLVQNHVVDQRAGPANVVNAIVCPNGLENTVIVL